MGVHIDQHVRPSLVRLEAADDAGGELSALPHASVDVVPEHHAVGEPRDIGVAAPTVFTTLSASTIPHSWKRSPS